MLAKIAIKISYVYQLTLSLLIGNQCRFFPSCSHYTQEAIELHGVVKGCCLGGKRILRCHPWHVGGFDPVPGSQIHSDVDTSLNKK